jgi:DNA-directed RNA polymerase specialized sigma24 family protein
MADDDEDDDNLAGEMPELDHLTVAGDDPTVPELAPALVRRFLSRQRALDIAAAVVRPVLPAQVVEDVAADAVVRALKARPPRVEVVLPSWLAEIARRVAARWLEKRARRAKYEGPMPVHKARTDDYTGHRIETHAIPVGSLFAEDVAEEAEDLLDPYLESIVAPHDRPILEALREHATTKKTYAALATEREMSVDQLDRRIRRFKAKYAPRVHRRRDVMRYLWIVARVAGVLVAAAVLVYVLLYVLFFHHTPPKDDALPDPATRPLPSATASTEAPLVAAQTLRDAKDLRDSAFGECRAGRWTECVRRLDAAKKLDPAGDEAPEVRAARTQAERGQERKP